MNSNKFTPFLTLTRREVDRFLSVWMQTFSAPVISAALYVIVFGQFIGNRIGPVEGISYMQFLIPGLVMMNVINTSYGGTSFSFFFSKWEKTINDLLTSPLSYTQIVGAIMLGSGVIRAFVIGGGVFVVLALFGGASLVNPLATIYFTLMTSLVFASLGVLAGLWAEKFDHFTVIQTFILTPLIYLGGVFYSINTLPEVMQSISKFNPILYMINGMRYGMTGVSDTSMIMNLSVVTVLAVIGVIVAIGLVRSGYKLRV